MQPYIRSLFCIFLIFYPFSPFSSIMLPLAPPRRPLKALVIFRHSVFKELIRAVHIHGYPGYEDVVEREYVLDSPSLGFQEKFCPRRILSADHFDLFEHYPGYTNGVWNCVLVFHGAITSVLIPKDLSLVRNPRLASIPNLARDLDTIYRLPECEVVDEPTEADLTAIMNKTTEEGSDSQFSGDAGQNSQGTQERPLFDLNALPSEAEEDESYPTISGTKRRKYKRASSKDVANLSLEVLSNHFHLPIIEAAKALNVGLTVLKKKCRQYGIPRWPHRKIKSLGSLIHDLQAELEKQQTEDAVSSLAVAKRRKLLEMEKERIVKKPDLDIQQETLKFRQDIFKRKYKGRVNGTRSKTLPMS